MSENWTPWLKHDGGPCPIPGVRGGDWTLRSTAGRELTGGALAHAGNTCYLDHWKHTGQFRIAAFRLRTDPDGWISHKAGDPCPVAGEMKVRVFLRKGFESRLPACRADKWNWANDNHPGDVIGWRPHNWPLAEPAKPEMLRVAAHVTNPGKHLLLWDGESYRREGMDRPLGLLNEDVAEAFSREIAAGTWRLLVPDWPHRAKAEPQRVIVPEPPASPENDRAQDATEAMIARDAAGADRSEWRDKVRGLLAEPAARPVRSPLQTVAPMERMAGSTKWGAV